MAHCQIELYCKGRRTEGGSWERAEGEGGIEREGGGRGQETGNGEGGKKGWSRPLTIISGKSIHTCMFMRTCTSFLVLTCTHCSAPLR